MWQHQLLRTMRRCMGDLSVVRERHGLILFGKNALDVQNIDGFVPGCEWPQMTSVI